MSDPRIKPSGVTLIRRAESPPTAELRQSVQLRNLVPMSTERTGVMIARAAGLILVIMGTSSLLHLLPWIDVPGAATSGWTSYSPLSTTTPQQDLLLHDTY